MEEKNLWNCRIRRHSLSWNLIVNILPPARHRWWKEYVTFYHHNIDVFVRRCRLQYSCISFQHFMSHSHLGFVDTWNLSQKRNCLVHSVVSSQYTDDYFLLLFVSFFRSSINTTVCTFVFQHMPYISKYFLENIILVLCISHQILSINEYPS